jgi:hypothetical protein
MSDTIRSLARFALFIAILAVTSVHWNDLRQEWYRFHAQHTNISAR